VPGVGERGCTPNSHAQTLAGGDRAAGSRNCFTLIQAELRRSGFEELLSSGIVLTGGSSVMRGMLELGEEVFHMPVRLGVPQVRGVDWRRW